MFCYLAGPEVISPFINQLLFTRTDGERLERHASSVSYHDNLIHTLRLSTEPTRNPLAVSIAI